MKNKISFIILFVLQGLMIIPAAVAIVPLVFSIANFINSDWTHLNQIILNFIEVLNYIIIVMYIVTYIISVSKSIDKRKISLISFMPLCYMAAIVFFVLLYIQIHKLLYY